MSKANLEKLIYTFISSRVDCCNGFLIGLPRKTLKKLQLMQNAAARVLTGTKRSEHITLILKSLQWLPVSHRIEYKAMLLVYKSIHGPNTLQICLRSTLLPRLSGQVGVGS